MSLTHHSAEGRRKIGEQLGREHFAIRTRQGLPAFPHVIRVPDDADPYWLAGLERGYLEAAAGEGEGAMR